MTAKAVGATFEDLEGTEGIEGLFAPAANGPRGPQSTSSRLDRVQDVLAHIEEALDDFGAPAFLVDDSGTVILTNAAARALGPEDLGRTQRSLTNAIAGTRSEDTWELRPLRSSSAHTRFVAVLRTRVRDTDGGGSLAEARTIWKLTPRQLQVLDLVARGYTNALIAEALGITESTVEFHITGVFDKAGVSNRATLIVRLAAIGRA